jgi:hypothetical protein
MKRTALTHFISALVFLFVTLTLYGFWYSHISAMSQDFQTLTKKIDQQTAAAADASVARAELDALAPQEAAVQQYFLSTTGIVSFIEQLSATGKYLGSKVTVVSVASTPATATTPNGVLSLSVTITGSFDSVMRTLGAIEYGPYETTITNLTLSTSGDNSSGATGPQMWNASAIFSIGTREAATTTPIL